MWAERQSARGVVFTKGYYNGKEITVSDLLLPSQLSAEGKEGEAARRDKEMVALNLQKCGLVR